MPSTSTAGPRRLAVARSTPAAPDELELPEDVIASPRSSSRRPPVAPGEAGNEDTVHGPCDHHVVADRRELAAASRSAPARTRPPAVRGWRAGPPPIRADPSTPAGASRAARPARRPFTRLPDVRRFEGIGLGRRHARPRRAARADAARVEPELSRALEAAGAAPIPITVVPVAELAREPGPAAKLKLIRNLRGLTPLSGGGGARRRRGGRARRRVRGRTAAQSGGDRPACPPRRSPGG